jgi:RNA 3'-phosphate cyclase
LRFVEVDGSQGEGGGQVLRAALAFSVILAKPVKVSRVRAGRDVPGLRRQHVSTLEILAEIFDGELGGASEGSSEVFFVPRASRVRDLTLDMGTAASITLVLQAVVPAAALSGSGVTLDLKGGTDVPWSPTSDYFHGVVRRAYAAAGIEFDMKVLRRGYYPRGGGRVTSMVRPSKGIRPLALTESAGAHDLLVLSRCGHLPAHVAERQKEGAIEALRRAGYAVNAAEATSEEADSPGSSVMVGSVTGGEYLGCDSLGEKGMPAEGVGIASADAMVRVLRSGACVDSNLADMLLPLLALADGPSAIRLPVVSSHLRTTLSIARQFTSCDYTLEEAGESWVAKIVPAGR